jgi:lipid-A-disaccharide synthase
MRVFVVTGEASGDMLAAALVGAMRAFVPDASFGGIGNERMAAAGVALTARTTGWGGMGPLEALRRIPRLAYTAYSHAVWLRFAPWDLIVLIDFGAFNLRLAKALRQLGYRKPILYLLPPGAWLDRASQARAVVRYTTPLTAFAHQRDFYRSLDLPVAYFGHPLVSLIAARAARPVAPAGGGRIALLPGSRRGEIERHLPPLVAAARILRSLRPQAQFVVSAADSEAEGLIGRLLQRHPLPDARLVRGARAAFDEADAAWIASGTAVLEATLREVPTVALYIIAEAQVPLAKRIWIGKHPYITLPNILLEREIVPECLQERATPDRLASLLEGLLADPAPQLSEMRRVREVLGDPDSLRRSAAFAVGIAQSR